MEFKNNNSSLKIQDNKVICENKNIVTKTISHLTINIDTIKEFEILGWKYKSYIIYFLGIVCFTGIFQKTHVVNVSYTYSYIEPYPIEYKIIWGCVSLTFILVGYFYNKYYGNYYSLNIKYYEGKIKSSPVYTSLDKEELTSIETQIKKSM